MKVSTNLSFIRTHIQCMFLYDRRVLYFHMLLLLYMSSFLSDCVYFCVPTRMEESVNTQGQLVGCLQWCIVVALHYENNLQCFYSAIIDSSRSSYQQSRTALGNCTCYVTLLLLFCVFSYVSRVDYDYLWHYCYIFRQMQEFWTDYIQVNLKMGFSEWH